MPSGRDIRAARKTHGLTQQELAAQTGLSQAYISLVERSDLVPETALAALSRVLELIPSAPAAPERPSYRSALTGPALPEVAGGLPLRLSSWRRPERSGDATLVLPLGDFAALIAALDVVGQGESAYPVTTYLLGWLRGRIGVSTAPPRLDVLAAELWREMQATGTDAGFFLAIVQRLGLSQEVRYEAIVDRYPAPLLLVGEPPRTIPSAGVVERGTGRLVVMPHAIESLSAPWRLVVASDGLLARLGGTESEGLRALRRWQSGPESDRSLVECLDIRSAPVDDESLLVAVWDGWDEQLALAAGDVAEEERVLRRLQAVVVERVGREGAARLVQAVLEALDNASCHAYGGGAGPVTVRWRAQEGRCSVEVLDEGRGIEPVEAAKEAGGMAVMRRLCSAAEARKNERDGTTVTLVVERNEGRGR